jgi:WG containing repeat
MRLDVPLIVALIAGALVRGAGAQPAPALFPITVNDRHGMIDRDGKVVIPPEYAEPVVFRNGLARVARGSKIAYLDAAGNFVISRQEAASDSRDAGPRDEVLGGAGGGEARQPLWVSRPLGHVGDLAALRVGSTISWGLAFVGPPGSRGNYIDSKDRVVWEGR